MGEITRAEIRALHEEAATTNPRPDVFLDLIWTHSTIVAAIAEQLAERMEERYGIAVNHQLLEAGALLHDIGVYACFDGDFSERQSSIRHGLLGYEFLLEHGIPRQLGRFALAHTGVGITRANIVEKQLPLPLPTDPTDEPYVPLTLEEELVAWADNFHSKALYFNTIERVRQTLTMHFAGNAPRVEYLERKLGVPELEELETRYADWQARATGFPRSSKSK